MTETTTFRGALIMPYPSALGPADEPLTIEWPEGHSYAVVATAFHGGAVLGTTATEDEGMGDLRSVAQDGLQVRLPGYRHPRRALPQARWESTKDTRRLTLFI